VTIVEVAVLAVATTSIAVLVLDRSVRRLFPRAWAGLAVALIVWLAVVATLTAVSRPGLAVLTVATALALAAVLVRARPEIWRGRALPPGALSPIGSMRALTRRDFYLEQARRHGPVFKMAQYRHKVICVVGLERAHRLIRERSTSLRSSPLPFTHEIAGGFLRYMDTDRHRLYAPLFRRALGRPVVMAGADVTAEVTARELALLAADGSATPTGGVRPGPYLERIVFASFLRVLFGLERTDALAARFSDAYRGLAAHQLEASLSRGAQASLAELREIVAAQGERLRRTSPAPLCSLTELARIDAAQPDAVAVDNLLFVLRLSTANVVSLLHWLLDALGRNPEWLERMRGDQTTGNEPDVIERVVMETLRTAQSEYLFRTVVEEFEHDGSLYPRGWQVRVCVWESHQDPAVFERPEQFCPDRFQRRDYSSSEYSPFGWGPHACNGVALTSIICRAVLTELVTYDVEVVAGGPPIHGARHWNHWQPSPELRVRLTAPATTPVR
jgi:cytochrome P450